MTDAETSTGRSTLRFDNDTHDLDVVVRLEGKCGITADHQILSDRPGTQLFTNAEGAGNELAYRFESGCITFEFPNAAFATTTDGRALLDSIDFLSRDRLRVISSREL